jgi:hypothetical protein
MAKVSLYLNKHLKFLVKTNMDLQERQEEALDSNLKSKHIKEINSKNKEIEENINNLKLEEFDEKNKEDKLMNNNINIVNNENEKNNNIDNINQNNKIKIKEIMHNDNNINDINNIYEIKKNKNIIEEEKNPEDPLISYITSNRKISEELIKNSSKLILEEIEGKLFNEKIIEINAGGMVGGRNKKDGFTIFGQNPEKSSNKDIFIPDLELNILNNENNFSYPYIFTIYYKIEDKSYYIRAYSGKGSENKILFIKLRNKNKYILNQKELISAGSIIFQITPINESELEIINLTFRRNNKIFDGNKQKLVTIGRHKECDFSFPKDKSFSRYQTCFEYDSNTKKWSIIDGKDKDSTNGTWIFGTHSFLIKNEMIVEILNSKIKIKEITN